MMGLLFMGCQPQGRGSNDLKSSQLSIVKLSSCLLLICGSRSGLSTRTSGGMEMLSVCAVQECNHWPHVATEHFNVASATEDQKHFKLTLVQV